jgi:regulator of protease activity HflC (stomatin/prohibitin superfamily)
MVVQSPIAGKLTWHTSAGVKWQGFGKVTKYPKREIHEFKTPVRFNDGGHGTMNGSVSYELPMDDANLNNIHMKFGNIKNLENQLIATVVNKAIYMTGPLMSSKESYAEKRNSLIQYVEDQIQDGVYKTTSKEGKILDPMTGVEKTVTKVDIVEKDGVLLRQEDAAMAAFGIKTFNFAINDLPYDAAVENQIKQQQQITMDVQTSIADAKKAEQNAITIEKQGQAKAAQAKWDQEAIKSKLVTEAEQKKEVAKLEKDAAEFEKQKQILLGQGEAERKKLVMSADGALDKKLEAWKEVNFKYAEMIKGSQLVPSVIMGGDGRSSSANDWIQLFMAKTAKDLALDMSVPQGGSK